MSHFTVLVVGDVEKQLAPFDENDRSRFTEKPTEEMTELRAEFDADNEGCATFEEYLTDYHGLQQCEGKWGSTYNPDSKWDWWKVGGRWPNQLVTKSGVACDSATIGDLDLDGMRAANIRQAQQWWAEAEAADAATRHVIHGITPSTTREQYIEKHAKFSTFAVVMDGKWFERGRMGWWATVSNEKPESDWQAEFDKLLASLPSDARITVVDCHI